MDGEKKRKVYDKQFKIDAVSLVTKGGRKVQELARELGIDPNTLYGWKRELEAAGEVAFPSNPPREFLLTHAVAFLKVEHLFAQRLWISN